MVTYLRSVIIVSLLLAFSCCFAQSPTVSYSGPQTYVINNMPVSLSPSSNGVGTPGYSTTSKLAGSGFNSPDAVTVDAAGNIYVTSFYETGVKKIPAGSNTPVVIGSGFSEPFDVAVDAAGNLYVADFNNNAIKKIPAGSNTPVSIGTGFTQPAGVAVDKAGNIFVADYGNNAVKEMTPDGSSITIIGSGFSNPSGVAVDAFGNVYVADYGNNAIKKIPAGSNTPVSIGTGISLPNGVCVDAAGNVFEDDYGTSSVKEILAGTNTTITLNTGAAHPYKITTDGAGNLYIADFNNTSLRINPPSGGYYIDKTLPAGLSFNTTTGVISGTPIAVSPATTYTITAYNSHGGTPAHLSIQVTLPPPPTISYATPVSYLINSPVSISPAASGVGAAAYGNKPVPLGSGFNSPTAVAIDGAGNIYVSNFYETSIKKITAGTNTIVQLGSGFAQPFDVAVDAAGNLYVADLNNNAVKKIPAGSNTPVTIGSGFNQPEGVAVDAAGNVYVADAGNNAVKEIMADGSGIIGIGSGFTNPAGVAVDVFGNIYVADYGNNTIKKILAGTNTTVSIGTGISLPNGVAVDPAGNVFEADYGTNSVKEILAATNTTITLNIGVQDPYKLTVDAAGNLLVADFLAKSIQKSVPLGGFYISKTLPAGLTFNNSTGIITGTPIISTAATNYVITAYNTGGGTAATLNLKINLPPAPVISYSTPQNYLVNSQVSLSPSAVSVAAPGFTAASVAIGSAFNNPDAVAVDAAGNIYISNFYETSIKKIAAGTNVAVSVGSGFAQPFDVAVDAAGNVYVADLNNNAVKEIPAGSNTPIIIGSGFSQPEGVAVDAAGNVYVADAGNNAIKKIPACNGTPVTLGSGFKNPAGVAVDAYGNIYVADYGNNAIKKIPAGSNTPVSIGTGISLPNGVAVDPAGNVFEADYGTNTVKEILAGTNTTITLNIGVDDPYKLTVNGSGALIVADFTAKSIKKFIPSGGFYLSRYLPAGLSFSTTTGDITGIPTAASPATGYIVSAYNIGGGATFKVTMQVNATASTDAALSALTMNGTLAPAFVKTTLNYTSTVENTVTNAIITPTLEFPGAYVSVNGVAVASGTATEGMPLSVGSNIINIKVLAQDGVTTKTYAINITRAGTGSSNALLSKIATNSGVALTSVAGPDYKDYTLTVPTATSSITITPTTQDATATVKVNGVTVASGTASAAIPLSMGNTVIKTVVTAQDGVTQNTYGITVTRGSALSNNALLTKIATNSGVALTTVAGADYKDYTLSVPNSTSTITVTPTTQDATATVKVNGVTVASGTASAAIPLAVGNTVINTVVTAQDGVTTKTYGITVTRAAMMALYHPKDSLSTDGIVIHEGVTPNGDGINDIFVIDGLTAYLDNKVTIMNRSGAVVYEAKGYDNQSKFFDGHSNKTGKMQLPGTYFYSLEYSANGKVRYTTGFIVLKY